MPNSGKKTYKQPTETSDGKKHDHSARWPFYGMFPPSQLWPAVTSRAVPPSLLHPRWRSTRSGPGPGSVSRFLWETYKKRWKMAIFNRKTWENHGKVLKCLKVPKLSLFSVFFWQKHIFVWVPWIMNSMNCLNGLVQGKIETGKPNIYQKYSVGTSMVPCIFFPHTNPLKV